MDDYDKLVDFTKLKEGDHIIFKSKKTNRIFKNNLFHSFSHDYKFINLFIDSDKKNKKNISSVNLNNYVFYFKKHKSNIDEEFCINYINDLINNSNLR